MSLHLALVGALLLNSRRAEDSGVAPQITTRESAGVQSVTAKFEIPQTDSVALAVFSEYEQFSRYMPDVRKSVIIVRDRGGCLLSRSGLAVHDVFQEVHLILEVVEEVNSIRFRRERAESHARQPVGVSGGGGAEMPRRSGMILGSVAVLFAAGAATLAIASRHQRKVLAEQLHRLLISSAAPQERSQPLQADPLPAPVDRYLSHVLRTAGSLQEVQLRQTGELRTDLQTERWMAFEAEHTAFPTAPGFVWDARIHIAPLLHVRVSDAFVEGAGSGRVSFLSAIPLGGQSDTPEMNSGSLHRYLAEAVWYPTALLPSAALRWTPLDATRATATLTVKGVSVSLEFRFNAEGVVSSIYTPARWGTFPGGYKQVPWEGHFRNYREWNGFVVPTEGDVGWYVGDEWRAVWKGRVTDFKVRMAR